MEEQEDDEEGEEVEEVEKEEEMMKRGGEGGRDAGGGGVTGGGRFHPDRRNKDRSPSQHVTDAAADGPSRDLFGRLTVDGQAGFSGWVQAPPPPPPGEAAAFQALYVGRSVSAAVCSTRRSKPELRLLEPSCPRSARGPFYYLLFISS